LKVFDKWRQLAIILDYEFGKGVSNALPKRGLRFIFSRRSKRIKQILHNGKLFATIRPNGAIALTIYGASILTKNKSFLENVVVVDDEAAEFVARGMSVFCKFVRSVGRNVLAGGEVVLLDSRRRVIGVGRAKMNGQFMREFNAGVAVKVRGGLTDEIRTTRRQKDDGAYGNKSKGDK
jgi:predicted RNA-binding protein (TIGR00451 family)